MMDNAASYPQKENLPRDSVLLTGFLVFNAVFRFSLLNLNEGEYTDGILQIIQFQQPDSFWPPLYTGMIWALRALGMEPIHAGRIISWASSVLLILPLWYVARLWAGRRAALYTLTLYTVSAMALRWSLRVMTDMPFTLFFHLACAGLLAFWAKDLNYHDEQDSLSADHGRRKSESLLLSGLTIASVLATLTRYQGILLAPLILLTLLAAWRRRVPRLWVPILTQLLWLTLPAWLLFQRFGHFRQIADRESPLGLGATLLNYWYIFETFVYLVPYFITLPVYIFFIIGLVKGPAPSRHETVFKMPIRALFLYSALAILVAQSAFQSFQSRYLLPLLPLALTFAGAGMARMENAMAAKGRWPRRAGLTLSATTILWSLAFALAVVFLQRGAFGDIFAAGQYIRNLNLPPSVRIYTNERYPPLINGFKLGFAAGRKAEMIPGIISPPAGSGDRMPPGSIVALNSAYSGGFRGQEMLINDLRNRFGYDLQLMDGGVFRSYLIPLLPDIMAEPTTQQNPLAWLLRYQRQDFQTQVFMVR